MHHIFKQYLYENLEKLPIEKALVICMLSLGINELKHLSSFILPINEVTQNDFGVDSDVSLDIINALAYVASRVSYNELLSEIFNFYILNSDIAKSLKLKSLKIEILDLIN